MTATPTDQELAEKSQKELVAIARRFVKKGHFRLYIVGNETKEELIKMIKDMSKQL